MAKQAVKTVQDEPRQHELALPDWMKGDIGKGAENIGRDDLETPRLKLIQALSPELQANDELRAGDFFHTAAEHVFRGPFRVVPLYMDKRYILWNPRDSGGGILARADDGVHWNPPNAAFNVKLDRKDGGQAVTWKTANTVQQSRLAEWGSTNPNDANSAPAATQMINYVFAFPDFHDLMPAVFTFQRSAVKYGRRFNTKIKTLTMSTPLFGLVFEMASFVDRNKVSQEFHSPLIKGMGRVQEEALYREYKTQHEMFAKAGLTIRDVEGLQDEAAPDDKHLDDQDNVQY